MSRAPRATPFRCEPGRSLVATLVGPPIVYATLGSAALIAFPLAFLAFKPQRRALTIDYIGVQTIIGRKSRNITWDKVANIVDEGEHLYVNLKNGNALIITRRAFTCDQELLANNRVALQR